MSNQILAESKAGRGSLQLPVGWAVLIAGLAIAAALLFQAPRTPAPFWPAGAVGSLQTVTLTNSTVYFGRLKSAEGSIVLTDVYEAIANTDPETKQRITRLVSRRKADWHGPLDMTIPFAQVLFMESIGPDSTVGKAIANAEQAPQPAAAPAAPATH